MAPSFFITLFLAAASAVRAAPSHALNTQRRTSTVLSPEQVSAFAPYTHYASAAYCQPTTTLPWSCGPNCNANPSFIPIASGGDGSLTQFWFVGFDPDLNEIIVSHQGTDTDEIIADLTDIDIPLLPLDPGLFPGVETPVMVHQGFAAAQYRSAPKVLLAVRCAMVRYNARAITITGHSLGAAIALLDALYIPLHLPNVSVRYVGYGLPRVGNLAFANYVDSQPISVTHITNRKDPIPILPPMALGFRHPSGEVHIQGSGEWVACSGQDNPSAECSAGAVSYVMFNETNHDGPYAGIEMGCPRTARDKRSKRVKAWWEP